MLPANWDLKLRGHEVGRGAAGKVGFWGTELQWRQKVQLLSTW